MVLKYSTKNMKLGINNLATSIIFFMPLSAQPISWCDLPPFYPCLGLLCFCLCLSLAPLLSCCDTVCRALKNPSPSWAGSAFLFPQHSAGWDYNLLRLWWNMLGEILAFQCQQIHQEVGVNDCKELLTNHQNYTEHLSKGIITSCFSF